MFICIFVNFFFVIVIFVDRMVWCKCKDIVDVNDYEKDLILVDQNWFLDLVVKELNIEENDFV